jgi:hypothetical protein
LQRTALRATEPERWSYKIPIGGSVEEKFWKLALTVGGLASVGAFVFWSLYSDWLSLPIFSELTSEQTYQLMLLFLWLTFASLVFLGGIYFYKSHKPSNGDTKHIFELHSSWDGVNEIDCEELIGPDVTSAVRALTITATAWLDGLVDKKVIIQNHFDDFELVFNVMVNCEQIIPGFEKRGLKCSDLMSDEIRDSYNQMKQYIERNKK